MEVRCGKPAAFVFLVFCHRRGNECNDTAAASDECYLTNALGLGVEPLHFFLQRTVAGERCARCIIEKLRSSGALIL